MARRGWRLCLRDGTHLRCGTGVLNCDAGLKAAEVWKQRLKDLCQRDSGHMSEQLVRLAG